MQPEQEQRPPAAKVFRLPGAPVAWWAWVAVAAACLIDIAVTGPGRTTAEIALTVLLATGVAYACVLRPRVLTDPAGITVRNPLRDHVVPWGSVTEIDMAESVRVHYLPEPGAARPKTIHSWALFAQRRARIRMELGQQDGAGRGAGRSLSLFPAFSAPSSDGQASALSRLPTAQLMATEMNELAVAARARGAAAGPRTVTWAWLPMAAVALPAIGLALVVTLTR